MPQVFLHKLQVSNFGPIVEDVISFETFTYLIGRNNAGKSHYLRAIEILLAPKAPTKDEISKCQTDRTKEIRIVGHFKGVSRFTTLVEASNHRNSIEGAIRNDELVIARTLHPTDDDKNAFGLLLDNGTIQNPGGLQANLLKVLPECISIPAIADTAEELKNTQNTALSKLKREAMSAFFAELKDKTKESLSGLDKFLHGTAERSRNLSQFETRFKEELGGEFGDVTPSVKFELPDEEIIAKEMKILLDDGFKSDVEQKGHGLQRATLLALLRMLAKYGNRYQNKPSPLFLLGEIESFLHPYAQKQFADVLQTLSSQYQIVTTTHSPFVIKAEALAGYRRISKGSAGTKALAGRTTEDINIDLIKRNLERRGNLEGLFADRIILVEGKHDAGCFPRLQQVLHISPNAKDFTLFIKTNGKEELRQVRKFYKSLQFKDVSIICDLDYLFSNDFVNLLREEGLDEAISTAFRAHIGWTGAGDPGLQVVKESLEAVGFPQNFDELLNTLRERRIFTLREGAPEYYFANDPGRKDGWEDIQTEADLSEAEELKALLRDVFQIQVEPANAALTV